MVIHSPLRRSVEVILKPGVTESQRVSRPAGDFVNSRSSVQVRPSAPDNLRRKEAANTAAFFMIKIHDTGCLSVFLSVYAFGCQ